MFGTLLSVSVLVALTASMDSLDSSNRTASFKSEDNPCSSLHFVYAFFRHGIRSPLYKPYPNDPNKSQYHHYFPGPPGELTKIGKQQMYDVGKKFNVRYGDFIGEYTEEKVITSSTNTSRTIMTALSVMAGFFPPKKPLFKNLRWQPIPVWQDTSDMDKAYIYNDPNFPQLGLFVCPRYGILIKEGYDITLKNDSTKDRHWIYEHLQDCTGNKDVNSVNSLYTVWDTLQFESLNGLPLPSWASEPQPHYENKPLYPDVMQPIMVEWFLDTEYLHHKEKILQFYSGPLFNNIHEHFIKKLQKDGSHEILRFHVTHDTTLFVLLWALRLKDPVTVGPGDGIIFELHKENNNHTVKVFYYYAGRDDSFQELILPTCLPPCSLHEFIRITPGLTPYQWQERCK